MEILFLCIVVFLFLLAVFDLSVGVSNDAVNFLNSAVGSGAASFKRVLVIASIGVFVGAAMSNGMMDIARHGIFRPEHFSFYDLIILYFIYLERLGLTEMLKYIAIVISYCDFHDKILPFLLYTQAVFLLCRSRLSAFHTLRFYIV